MADIIIGLIVAAILILAIRYIYISKKRGKTCIGCSSGGCCPHKGNSNHSCCDSEKK